MMPCPGCRRSLEPTGEIDMDGQKLTVYQCDDCVVSWKLEGQEFPAALTFAIDEDGRMFDPNTFEPLVFPAQPSDN
jgi:hypothetical protein